MPDLLQSLIDQDFGFIQILADLWQVDAPRVDTLPERAALVRRVLEPETFNSMLAELPENAGRVLAELQQNEGRMLWNTFIRKFGEVREFGSGKREREQPHLHPISPSEVLWYRALISKAFLKRSGVPQEFAFIPSDILEMLPPPAITTIESPSLKVIPRTTDYLASSSGDDILDQCCTLLAAMRLGITDLQSVHLQISPEQVSFLSSLLKSSQIIDDKGIPSPEETREHLESSRSKAWQFLFRGWSSSSSIRDLFSIPEFTVERAEEYSPVNARSIQLSEISGLPVGEWILFEDYLKQIQNSRAEFLRPDGNFDTWLIRSSDTGGYLNGYSRWNDVEGAYIRHLIRGPLFWLGVVELGYSSHANVPACFRVTIAGHLMLLGASPEAQEETARILFKPGSQILCPTLVPRWVRYLLARMSEWMELTKDGYLYQFTPQSLAAARKQTLHVSHLVSLLRKYGAVPPPPSLIRSFQRWEDHGSEVSLENIQILRVTTPEILQQIMKSRAARYLAEPLGPTAVVIKPGVSQKLSRLLIELGYLSEIK